MRLLAQRGASVIGIDAGAPQAAEGLVGDNVEILLDGDRSEEVVDRVRCVVKSPGVPSSAPVVAAARSKGLPVIGEVELAWRLLPNRFVAVTGTNGKTTVSELLGHIWRIAGEPVAVAGNVGTALTTLVGKVPAEATIVCEVSSFQLEDTEAFAPECRRPPQPHARPSGPPRELRGIPRRQAADVRQPEFGRRGRLQRCGPRARESRPGRSRAQARLRGAGGRVRVRAARPA